MKIVVIGDLIIDETYYVKVNKVSPEAPIISVTLMNEQPIQTPGGAGFAAAWAAARDIDTWLISPVSPFYSPWLWFSHHIRESLQLTMTGATNIRRIRYIDVDSGYHLLRVENDSFVAKPEISIEAVIQAISDIEPDICLISDYAKGMFTNKQPWDNLITYLKNNRIPSLLDTRSQDISIWADKESGYINTWVKLNLKEYDKMIEYYNLIQKPIPIQQLIVTKGAQGASLTHDLNNPLHMPINRNPIGKHSAKAIDVTGCGDIFDISFLISLTSSLPLSNCLQNAVNTASDWAEIPFEDKQKCLLPRHKG